MAHEVDGPAVDLGSVLCEPVDPALLRAPIEAINPVGCEVLHESHVGSVAPTAARGFVWPLGLDEPTTQRVKLCLGKFDAKRRSRS